LAAAEATKKINITQLEKLKKIIEEMIKAHLNG
jgi:hypothetical protein